MNCLRRHWYFLAGALAVAGGLSSGIIAAEQVPAERELMGKLDQILDRLQSIETRLDRIERSYGRAILPSDNSGVANGLRKVRVWTQSTKVPHAIDEGMLIDAMQRRASRVEAGAQRLPETQVPYDWRMRLEQRSAPRGDQP